MKIRLLSPLCLLAVLAGCAVPEPPPAPEPVHSASTYEQAALLAGTMEFLHQNYVDADRAGYEKLLTAALRGMMRELDPYSGYEPPAVYETNEIARTGEHTGIGVELVKPGENSPLVVTMTVPDSPAAKAGLVPGDRIVRIDDKLVEPLPLEECAKLLRGAAGSSVRLEVVPDGGDDSRNIAVRREKVVVSSAPVEAAHLIGGDIGYLRINSFNSHTPSETAAVLEKLRKEGMTRGLVIDLRNNPGGLVSGASETASLFLPEGAELFSARHRNTPEAQVVKAAAGAEKLLDLPIVILINPFTASAAELFSGAMQDHRRATLVGMKSFGKGTLLQVVPLANGGALRYAAGYYRTPKGQVIEGRGLRPDIPVELGLPQIWRLNAQLAKHPGIVRPGGKDAVRDTQLEAALSLFPDRSDAEKSEQDGK